MHSFIIHRPSMCSLGSLRACSSLPRLLLTSLPRTSSSRVLCQCLARRSLFHHPLLLRLRLNCHHRSSSLFRCHGHHFVEPMVPVRCQIVEHSSTAPFSFLCQVDPRLHRPRRSPQICSRLPRLDLFTSAHSLPIFAFHLGPGN